jgi:hypothetical protein
VGAFQEYEDLRSSCIEDGLLKEGFGHKLRITKEGREFVKLAAILDEDVARELQAALRAPWMERRGALAAMVLLARERMPAKDESGGPGG